MTSLAAEGLAVTRGGRTVLAPLDAAFAAGRLTAVIGPNGAGKSTLLAALAGLIAPSQGRVLLGGAPLAALGRRALARTRAYLPQSPRAEWPISVRRLVALGLGPDLPTFGEPSPDQEVRIAAAIAACDLIPLAQRPATALSGGELARAMLARAIVSDPRVLIVDEPTAGLDPRHAIDALARLGAQARRGAAVIVALHDLDLALRFADDVVALRDGALIAAGPTLTTIDEALLARLYDVRAQITRDQTGAAIRFLD